MYHAVCCWSRCFCYWLCCYWLYCRWFAVILMRSTGSDPEERDTGDLCRISRKRNTFPTLRLEHAFAAILWVFDQWDSSSAQTNSVSGWNWTDLTSHCMGNKYADDEIVGSVVVLDQRVGICLPRRLIVELYCIFMWPDELKQFCLRNVLKHLSVKCLLQHLAIKWFFNLPLWFVKL